MSHTLEFIGLRYKIMLHILNVQRRLLECNLGPEPQADVESLQSVADKIAQCDHYLDGIGCAGEEAITNPYHIGEEVFFGIGGGYYVQAVDGNYCAVIGLTAETRDSDLAGTGEEIRCGVHYSHLKPWPPAKRSVTPPGERPKYSGPNLA